MFVLLTVVCGNRRGYRVVPQSFVRIVLPRCFAAHYLLMLAGFDRIPRTGGVLLLGNRITRSIDRFTKIASQDPFIL